MDIKYPHFRAALLELSTDPATIAEKLQVKRRMAYHYLAGDHLPRADKLVHFPELIDALRRDADVIREAEEAQTPAAA